MRSATEINANKDIELTGNEANLVAYYKFNDGSGQIATDQSSTTNNAVLGSSNTAYTDDPTWVKVNHAITSVSSYRYGFNGMEKDDAVAGEGNVYDYGFRIYNPRLGRFLSVDPLRREYSMLSTYQYSSNSPIVLIDVDGLEGAIPPQVYQLGNYIETEVANAVNTIENTVSIAMSTLGSLFAKNTPTVKIDGISGADISTGGAPPPETEVAKPKVVVAKEIKMTGNVTFDSRHANKHTPDDDANADDNINDAAKGEEMSTSKYAHAKGAKVALNDNSAKAFLSLAKKYKMNVSEIAGAGHGSTSLHYQGKAWDVNYVNGEHMTKETDLSKAFIKDAKAAGFIVVGEYKNNHIHLQWGSNKKPKK